MLENCGIEAASGQDDFTSRTVEAGWNDIALLIEMFAEIQAARKVGPLAPM